MNLLNFRREIINKFIDAGIQSDEAVTEVKLLFEHFLSLKIMDLYSKNIENIDPQKMNELNKHLDIRLNERIPVQYLVGYSYFYGLKFIVNKDVLIPRKDTEILVETVLDKLEYLNISKPQVADVGTGSGCISVAIAANEKRVSVIATDISEQAVKIAQQNADFNNQGSKITFINTSLLNNVNQSFDIVLSNPPYIPKSRQNSLAIEVTKYEPAQALFVEDEDVLKYYREISLQAMNMVNPNGYLIFEIDSPQNDNIKDLLSSHGWKKLATVEDYNRLPRVIVASK